MNPQEILNKLGIDAEVVEEDSKQVAYLEDSDEFAKAYTKFDKSDLVDLDPSSVISTEEKSVMIFISDDYDITLEGNYDTDEYKIIFEE